MRIRLHTCWNLLWFQCRLSSYSKALQEVKAEGGQQEAGYLKTLKYEV